MIGRPARGLLLAGAAAAICCAGACSSTVALSPTALRSVPALAGLPTVSAISDRAEPMLALALAEPIACSGEAERTCTAHVTYTDVGPLPVQVPVSRTTALVSAGVPPALTTSATATQLHLDPGSATSVEWSATSSDGDLTDGDLTGVALVYAGFRYTASADGSTAEPAPASASPSTASPSSVTPSPPAPSAASKAAAKPKAIHTSAAPTSAKAPVYVPPVARTFPIAPPVRRNPDGAASVSATIG